MSISGKWQELTKYLKENAQDKIVLTDEEIQEITGSTDNTRPYGIDFPSNPKYSIQQRAKDAGYDVKCHSLNHQVKVFEKV